MNIDMHMHSSPESPCAVDSTAAMIAAAQREGMGALAITNHGVQTTFEGINYFSNRLIIPAVEVSWYHHATGFGADILLYAVDWSLLAHVQDVMYGFDAIFPQAPRSDWLAIWAHPIIGGGMGGGSFDPSIVNRVLSQVDAIEGINGGVAKHSPECNTAAQALAEEFGVPWTAGSDAHEAAYVASAYTVFNDDVETARQLFRAVRRGEFSTARNPRP
jgi:predicted metal-dependent phosphoesterase TrpH